MNDFKEDEERNCKSRHGPRKIMSAIVTLRYYSMQSSCLPSLIAVSTAFKDLDVSEELAERALCSIQRYFLLGLRTSLYKFIKCQLSTDECPPISASDIDSLGRDQHAFPGRITVRNRGASRNPQRQVGRGAMRSPRKGSRAFRHGTRK
jgi:hypothetical protein